MKEIVSIFLIGISLSMDTFSLSLTLGTIKTSKRIFLLPILVGIFHFFMPLIGNFLGFKIIDLLSITTNKLLGVILILLAINIFYHYFKEETINVNLSIIGLMLLALSVSIDSFSVGLGFSALTTHQVLASFIFSLCSSSFTYLGLTIGKYCTKHLGKLANFIGIIMLFILGLIHLFK